MAYVRQIMASGAAAVGTACCGLELARNHPHYADDSPLSFQDARSSVPSFMGTRSDQTISHCGESSCGAGSNDWQETLQGAPFCCNEKAKQIKDFSVKRALGLEGLSFFEMVIPGCRY